MNKVVVRYSDGRILKGTTNDFLPAKGEFHLAPAVSNPGEKPLPVRVMDLKALFFVKDFAGNREREESVEFPATRVTGRKIRVVFADGEVLIGTTQGYDRSRPGFFVVPADPGSNNERVFVVTGAAQDVAFI